MDLHDHRRVNLTLLNLSMQSYHRHLYQVRRAALNRGIDGYPLGLCPRPTHRSIQLRQVAPAPKHGRDVAILASTVQGFLEPRAHPRQAFEVPLDIVRGLRERNAQFTRKPGSSHPIDDPEINDLCEPAGLGVHLTRRDSQYFHRGPPMDACALLKSRHQGWVARNLSQHPQIDMRTAG